MRKNIYFFMCVVCTLLGVACNESVTESVDGDEKQILIDPVYPSISRVTDLGFEQSDKLGLYMTKAGETLQLGGNVYNNEMFTFDGSVWKSRKLYWDKGSYDMYAYYPYLTGINDVRRLTFKVSLDQNKSNDRDGMSGYEASDFLWASRTAVEASANPVSLKFQHVMSKLVIKLVKGKDYEGEIPDNFEVFIHNTVPVAAIDLTNGGASKADFENIASIRARKVNKELFTACLVPQQISSRRPLVEVVSNGVSYLLEGKISLKQGMQHTIVVTLSKNSEQIKIEIGGEIENWNH